MSGLGRKSFSCAASALVLAIAGRTNAALIEPISETSFNSSASTPTILTFEGLDTSSKAVGYTKLGLSLGQSGVSFANANQIYAVTAGFGSADSNGNTYLSFNGTLIRPNNSETLVHWGFCEIKS